MTNYNAMMQQAIKAAQTAEQMGELPVGVALFNAVGECVATAHNQTVVQHNPLAHAEMQVITDVLKREKCMYLEDYTLAVTLEPCAMCAQAISWARVGTVIFGAWDVKSGGLVSGARVIDHMHHKPRVVDGVEEESCKALLQNFFAAKRV